jgi:arabinogalactan oligomer/maltooligosaccharide transport system permease protein
MLVPIVALVYISITDATYAVTILDGSADVIGIENYVSLLSDSQFWTSFGVTWLFVGVSLILKLILSVTIALVLTHTRVIGKRYMRAAIIIPMGFPPIFSITIWRQMFSGARFGVINQFLANYNDLVVGLANTIGASAPALLLADVPITWLSSRWSAFFAYVMTEVWLAYPFMVIIIVSALQDVPKELHDAAKVDGAGFLWRFVTVTLPSIKRPALFASILTAATSFQQFLVPWVFNEGGPARKNELLLVYGYREAIQLNQFGLASAIMVTTIAFIGMFMWLGVKKGQLAQGVGNE